MLQEPTHEYTTTSEGRGAISTPFTTPHLPHFYDHNQTYPVPESNVYPIAQYASHSFDQAPYPQPNNPGAYLSEAAPIEYYNEQNHSISGQFQQYYPQQVLAEYDEVFAQYQTQVRQIFTHVNDGNLAPTADLLLKISHYLLGNARNLGMHIV